MSKNLTVYFADNDDWENHAQSVTCLDEDIPMNFYVHDLSECPEDAIIGRDLFDGEDYIKAIKLGIQIASMGYTGVGVEHIPYEE